MVECPKCHFVQPDDDFCANCGVNMKLYRRNHPSAAKWKSLLPYALTFCLIGILVGFLVLQLRPGLLNKTATTAPSTATQAQSSSASAKASAHTDTPHPTARENPEPTPQQESSDLEDEVATAEQPAMKVNAVADKDDKKEEKFTIESLEVYFLEVPKQNLSQLSQEGTVLSESSAGLAVWIAGAESKNAMLQKGRVVTDQNYRQASPSESSPLKIVYQGGIKKDDEIVFQMQISPKTVDEKKMRLHVSGMMKWLVDESAAGSGSASGGSAAGSGAASGSAAPLTSSTSSSFDSTYSISGPGQLVLTGTIPQGRRPAAMTRDVLEKTPLGILNSDSFHKKTTELMIVISVK